MISINRAKTILQCYGGQPCSWPQHERQDLQQAIAHSKVLKLIQKEALALDNFMGFCDVEENIVLENICAAQIMANLPEQNQSNKQVENGFLNTIFIKSKQYFNVTRPILLAASTVLVVIGLSNGFQSLEYIKVKNEATEILSLSEYMDLYVDDGLNISNETNDEADELEILAFLDPQIMEDNN